MKRILFVGGGTGGHIVPLLAVMAAFQEVSSVKCHYVGSENDMLFPAIKDSLLSFEKHVIATGKLNRYITWRHIPEAYGIMAGLWQALALLKRLQPTLIFSKGGAASVPVAWAASRLGIPIYAHETDAAAGLANRFVAGSATTIFTAFPIEVYEKLPVKRAVYVGQPVRAVFRTSIPVKTLVIEHKELGDDLPVITVTGGSQGGRGLNNLVKNTWESLLAYSRMVMVCGPHDLEALREARLALSPEKQHRLQIISFLGEEFPDLIKRSTVVITRAGGTIFELAAAQKPAILVPLPTAAQDHQRKNAEVLRQAEAALYVEQDQVTNAEFIAIVRGLIEDKKQQARLAERIAQFDRPKAAQDMAQVLVKALS